MSKITRTLFLGLGSLLLIPHPSGANPVPPPPTFLVADGCEGDDGALAVLQTGDYGYVVAGYASDSQTSDKDILVARYTWQARVRWRRVYGGSGDDEARGIVQGSDNSLYLVGSTRSLGDGEDLFVSKFTLDGVHLWTRTWSGGGGAAEALNAVIRSSDNTIWATGYTTSYSPVGRTKLCLFRIESGGETLRGSIIDAGAGPGLRLFGNSLAMQVFNPYICVGGRANDGSWDRILVAHFTADSVPQFLGADVIGSYPFTQSCTSVLRTSAGTLALGGSVTYQHEIYRRAFVLDTDEGEVILWGRQAQDFPFVDTEVGGLSNVEMWDPSHAIVAVGRRRDLGGGTADAFFATSWSGIGDQLYNRAWEVGEEAIGRAVCPSDVWEGYLSVAGSTAEIGMGGEDLLLGLIDYEGQSCWSPVAGPAFTSWNPTMVPLSPTAINVIVATQPWDVTPGTPGAAMSGLCYSNGLIAHWPMDQCQGTQVSEVYGYNGTLSGAQWIYGSCGCGLSFSGARDLVAGIGASLDDPFAGGFSLQTTLRWQGPAYGEHVIFDARSQNRGFYLRVSPDGRLLLTFLYPDGQSQLVSSVHSLPIGTNCCLGFAHEPLTGAIRLYLDGVLEGSEAAAAPYAETHGEIAIGNSNPENASESCFHGEIYDLFLGVGPWNPDCIYTWFQGACCFPDGTCCVMGYDECADAGGTIEVLGRSCAPNPCPVSSVPAASDNESARAVWLVGPNPFDREVRFELSASGPARIEIFDVAGRLVRSLSMENAGAAPSTLPSSFGAGGTSILVWDARNDEGKLQPPGVYLVRLTSGGLERRQTIIKLH